MPDMTRIADDHPLMKAWSAYKESVARREALEEAARIARNGCLVPPDGGSPTQEEADMCDRIAEAILALVHQ